MATRVDYAELEKEYVTSELSIREIARRYGLSWSTLAARARNENWKDKRLAYTESVARRSYERIADRYAADQAEIQDESITVARATLRAYAEALRAGSVKVTTKDAMLAVTVLRTLMGEPSNITEARTFEFNGGGFDAAAFQRLAELARTRLVEGTVVGDPPSLAEGTLPN